MKGGRLKIVNESRYPTDEVAALVRYALADIDVKGAKLIAVVQNNRRREYRGWGGKVTYETNDHVRALARQHNARYYAQVLLGKPGQFPTRPFTRNGITIGFADWQEALVGVMAHEGMHAQHAYDGAYASRNGTRRWMGSKRPMQRYRVGANRVEHKCRAVEYHVLERFRGSRALGFD